MMGWLWWVACSWSPAEPAWPEGLDPNAVVVRVASGAFDVHSPDGSTSRGRVPWSTLDADPVNVSDETLVAAFRGASGLWVDLPASLPWYRARKVLGSARAAGVDEVVLSIEGEPATALRVGEEPLIGLKMTCRDGPMAWTKVQPRITVALQSSREGTWAVANARFLPVVDGVPTDGLPSSCLAPVDCASWYEGATLQACEAGRSDAFGGRVSLGGEVGCLLPFLNSPDELPSWVSELPPVLERLRLSASDPVLVSPEARVRWDAVVVTLRAFPEASLPVPSLGKPLVEGNDGPPVCNADVRDGDELALMAARRAGTLMGAPKGEE